jgi:transcriptional regulator with XRE-family HTH domain
MIDIELFIRLRRDKKLSQLRLGKAVGMSQQLIAEIEKGRTRSTKVIYQIAQALGTTASLLDPAIPAVEGRLAKIQQDLIELGEENAAFLLDRFENDIELLKRSKR